MGNINSQRNNLFIQLGYFFGVINVAMLIMLLPGLEQLDIENSWWKLIPSILAPISLFILFLSNQKKFNGSDIWSIVRVSIICIIFLIAMYNGALFNGDIRFN